jgi:hypothetical protein
MDRTTTPTLAQVLQLLRELGFISVPAKVGVIAYTHANSGTEFLFRDRELDTPARESELANLHIQLTFRGLITEDEFDRFLWGRTLPTSSQ